MMYVYTEISVKSFNCVRSCDWEVHFPPKFSRVNLIVREHFNTQASEAEANGAALHKAATARLFLAPSDFPSPSPLLAQICHASDLSSLDIL